MLTVSDMSAKTVDTQRSESTALVFSSSQWKPYHRDVSEAIELAFIAFTVSEQDSVTAGMRCGTTEDDTDASNFELPSPYDMYVIGFRSMVQTNKITFYTRLIRRRSSNAGLFR